MDRLRPAGGADDTGFRELVAVREIVNSFLTARRPEEVFQLALDRVSPLVGASFACVYVVDEGTELMRLAAIHNWPQRLAGFLKQIRVRVGAGPSGAAAGDRRPVEVADVFGDPALEDWHDVARELGFRSIVSMPLQTGDAVMGTVTFYFTEPGALTDEARHLLQTVAAQMAATAEKARLIEDLRRANGALRESNEALAQQNAALEEARRVKDEFLANMSHELRTPLTAVIGYTALVQEGIGGPLTDEQQHTLGQVRASSEQLLNLIGDLLDLTTLRRGGLEAEISEFGAEEALRDAVAATGGRREGVALALQVPESPIPVVTDRRKVTRILGSLLANAYKFTDHGEVRVTAAPQGDRVVYEVSDTGPGIPVEAQELVFEEFRQVDGTMTRRHGGSGLGLSLARRLAQFLGGDITVVSAAGQGSTFRVELPVRYAAPATAATTMDQTAPTGMTS
jgi:signal transduction histidine kinase